MHSGWTAGGGGVVIVWSVEGGVWYLVCGVVSGLRSSELFLSCFFFYDHLLSHRKKLQNFATCRKKSHKNATRLIQGATCRMRHAMYDVS
jgi:hypothetical protein